MSDKIKELSDAIRLGATFRGQCYGSYSINGLSCALGAAMEAIGVNPDSSSERKLMERLSMINDLQLTCPMCATTQMVTGMVIHLNDKHYWPRETIADYLESNGY